MTIKKKLTVCATILFAFLSVKTQVLYDQTGVDSSWEKILENELIPIGVNSTDGVQGSLIDVNNTIVETGQYASNPIIDNLKIHTLGNSYIARKDFSLWNRWYQEDGNTQVFRLFKNEENVRNDRALAARVESFDPSQKWLPEPGVWHQWTGHYTVVKSEGCSEPHNCTIFQAKGNNVDHWSVMLNVDDQGNLWLNRRRGNDSIIATEVIGKSFDIKVLDNGLDYEVYFNDEFMGDGQWQRTEEIGFRWGIYVGESVVKSDIMVFVTGATIDSQQIITNVTSKNEKQIKLFPNPTYGQLTLNTVAEEVQLYDIQGALLHIQNFTNTIDLSNCMPGIYYVKINNKTYKVSKK